MLKIRKKLATLAIGQILRVAADDPMSPLDIGLLCKNNDYPLELEQKDNIFYFTIQKTAPLKQ